jgi:hypothetical protein
MDFGDSQSDAHFPDDAFDPLCSGDFQMPSSSSLWGMLPQAPSAAPESEAPKNKRKRPESPDTEVLDSGFINRAPVPIDQAERLETAAGVEEGTYFVELMRKRLRCIHDMQVRWVTRTCNKKKPKYVETQTRLRDFAGAVIDSFESQFGPASVAMVATPTRKHVKPKSAIL